MTTHRKNTHDENDQKMYSIIYFIKLIKLKKVFILKNHSNFTEIPAIRKQSSDRQSSRLENRIINLPVINNNLEQNN